MLSYTRAFLGVQLDAVLAGSEKRLLKRTNRDAGELRNLVDCFTWTMLRQLLSHPSECAYALHCIGNNILIEFFLYMLEVTYINVVIEFGTDMKGGGDVNHQSPIKENKNQFRWFPRSCLPILRHISESAVFHPSALSRTSAACAR